MKYFIRAVKYFFYFTIIFVLIVSLLIFTGAAQGDIPSLFRDGYESLWKIAIFLAAVAALYPKFGFMTRTIKISGTICSNREQIRALMGNYGYRVEKDTDDVMTFRHRNPANRLFRMFEDRITITATLEGLSLEGLRKDVMRVAAGLGYRLNPEE